MPGMVSWSLIATPRCCMYQATVPSGSGELITTCESDTGIDSSGSISRAVRCSTSHDTSRVRPSPSKNRNP